MKASDFNFISEDGKMHIYVDFKEEKVTFSTEKCCIEISIDELNELNSTIQDELDLF